MMIIGGTTVLFLLTFVGLFDYNECQEVDIQCVHLYDCPDLYDLVKKEQATSQKTLKVLESALCGYDGIHPKVWCAVVQKKGCRTAKGENGRCIPFRECKPFVRLLSLSSSRNQETYYYLRRSQCPESSTSKKILTCCPHEETPKTDLKPPLNLPVASKGECGQQSLNKIVGGRETEPDEFPWTVLLEYRTGPLKTTTPCAGSLISNRYVVTAAHCVDDTVIRSVGKLINVILGEFDTRNETDCINRLGVNDCADPPVRMGVEERIIFPGWGKTKPGEINHDIALLRLSREVRFTNYIKPICLPPKDLIIKEQALVVAGWGRTENEPSSYVKLKTTLSMADTRKCIERYELEKKLIVGDGEICVGGERGNDSCSGDSGGPLMLFSDKLGAWFLAGIVSFGPNPCGIQDFPGLYTFVPKYVDWIYEMIKP